MINNKTIIDKATLKGGLSDEITSSEFYKIASDKPAIGGYLGSADRTEFRDKAMETYLRAKGCKENGAIFLLLGKDAGKMMSLVNDQTTAKEFVELMKKHLEKPLQILWELFYKSGIKAMSNMRGEITRTNIEEIEEAAKIFLKTILEPKATTKPAPVVKHTMEWEGRYENTEPGHDKFWEVIRNAAGNYEARWGKRGKTPLGSKEYGALEASKVVYQKLAKGYRKVS